MQLPDAHQIVKWAITAAIFMIAAFCMAYCSTYNNQTQELAVEKSENKILTDSNEALKDTIEHDKQELAKLLRHQEILRKVLEKREQRIKELQSDVYKRINDLEQLAKDDAAIGDSLSATVPDVVWDKIIRETFTCSSNSCENGNGAAEGSQAVPEAVPAEPAADKNGQGSGAIHY